MVLGELAFATGRPRDSTVWADSVVECYALSAADLSDLARRRPTAEAGILRNLVGITSERASQMRSELALTTD
jgi:CRP-like cAMP-binding protein